MYYYMTIGQKKLANAIAIVQGYLIVAPASYLLSASMGENGIWLAFSIAEAVTILMIFCSFTYLKQSQPQKYSNLLLLDQTLLPPQKIFEQTLSDKNTDMSPVAKYLTETGHSQEEVKSIIDKTEEIIIGILRAKPPKAQLFVDIRVRSDQNKITFNLRDDGKGNTPAETNPAPFPQNGFTGSHTISGHRVQQHNPDLYKVLKPKHLH